MTAACEMGLAPTPPHMKPVSKSAMRTLVMSGVLDGEKAQMATCPMPYMTRSWMGRVRELHEPLQRKPMLDWWPVWLRKFSGLQP